MLNRRRLADAGPWLRGAAAAVLFLLAFAFAFWLTLPGDVLLSSIRSSFAARGIRLEAGKCALSFPTTIRMDNVVLAPAGTGDPLRLDTAALSWDWIGLFRGLPASARLARGASRAEVRLSPMFWKPSRGEIRADRVASEDLPGLSSGGGFGFLLSAATVRWTGTPPSNLAGTGEASFEFLRVPIPDAASPVREADLRNVRTVFALRGGNVVISSLTGRFEGSDVEGTGEIARFLSPGSSTISFNLRVRNPFEGRIGTLFDMVAKNAKSATLRVNGPLFSPRGEMLLF